MSIDYLKKGDHPVAFSISIAFPIGKYYRAGRLAVPPFAAGLPP